LAGLYNSKNDFDVCVSADLQDPILMINEMYSQTLNGQQLVVAYRYKRSDSILTRFTSRVAYRLLSAEYENMPHTGFDFFLLSKKVKLELLKLKGRRRFLQGDLLSLGFDAKFLPYSRTKRQFGKSSYNFRSRFVLFLDFLFDSSYRPLRMISFSGGLISIMSVAIIAVALWNYFYEGNVIDGFTPIYIGIFFFGGLQLLALGIISEYVLRLSEIVSEKPVWILASEE
jgi:dolichol-phosphate mannosyltransferase